MINENDINWEKGSGMIPAIIQDADNSRVLMLGYMDREALQHTLESGRVSFHSRSRNTHWVKGETSGNYLNYVSAEVDCDGDTLIAQKVGEEGVELSLALIKEDKSEILNEAADLLFHMMVLLESSDLNIEDVCDVLNERFN